MYMSLCYRTRWPTLLCTLISSPSSLTQHTASPTGQSAMKPIVFIHLTHQMWDGCIFFGGVKLTTCLPWWCYMVDRKGTIQQWYIYIAVLCYRVPLCSSFILFKVFLGLKMQILHMLVLSRYHEPSPSPVYIGMGDIVFPRYVSGVLHSCQHSIRTVGTN